MRPKTFDQNEALGSAMIQFWSSGFAGSSMQDLVDRMGISRQSLYDTYGNKRELFEAALRRYREEIIEPKLKAIGDPALPPPEAVREYFRSVVDAPKETPPGCLVVRSATEISVTDHEVGALLEECAMLAQETLSEVVERGQQTGDFDRSRSVRDLVGCIMAAAMGMHVLKRLPYGGRHLRPSVDALVAGLAPRRDA